MADILLRSVLFKNDVFQLRNGNDDDNNNKKKRKKITIFINLMKSAI